MGYVRLEKDLEYNGLRMLRLESDLLRLDLFPQLGGKIYRWVHKPEDRDWLWQHPNIQPAILAPGASYDETFCGGWDEQFPSDAACELNGIAYPDHGDYWAQSFEWDVEQAGDSLSLHMWAEGAISRTRMERWITISAGSTVVRLKHRITHLGEKAFDYLWKFHPFFAVGESYEIVVPAGRGIIAEPGSGRLSADRLEFTWPHVPGADGKTIDLSRTPKVSELGEPGPPGYEMVYLTELHEGWFALLDHESRSGFGLAFDKQVFNNVWLFQTFGGWQGLHTLVLEPSTGYPYVLPDAVSRGRVSRLEPGQVLETECAAVIFTDCDKVEHITRDGVVE